MKEFQLNVFDYEVNIIKIITLPVGYLRANCYLYFDEHSLEAAVIDPGDDLPRLIAEIDKIGLFPKAVLLTHGHFDHAGAAEGIGSHYRIPVCAYKVEAELLSDKVKNGSHLNSLKDLSVTADKLFADGESVGFGLAAIHTPGHTSGGCCFYSAEEKILFTGDTLFALSIGRSDFPTGDHEALINSIKNRLFTLPGDTVVLPGHGERTTIAAEAAENPYVRP